MSHSQRGFGLIELIVVLLVSAVLLSVALPSFSRAMERQRAVAAVNQLNAAMGHARLLALTSRGTGVVCPTSDGESCRYDGVWDGGWITFVDRDGNRMRGGDEPLLRVDAPPHDTLRIRSSAARSRAVFLPNGTSGGANLTLRVCSGSDIRAALIVNNGGRARTASARELADMEPCGT